MADNDPKNPAPPPGGDAAASGSASSGLLGKAAIIAAILVPLAQVSAPIALDFYKARAEARIRADEVSSNERIEESKRRVEVTKLFFEQFVGQPAEQQKKLLVTISILYPEQYARLAKAFANESADEAVRQNVNTAQTAAVSVQQMDNGRPPDADVITNEREGFKALLGGDLTQARNRFGAAYTQFPTYHNVDEIYNGVLTRALVDEFNRADAGRKAELQKNALTRIYDQYRWGIPPDILPQIKAAAGR
ncbi:MAG TPA: hypothetical protein VF546_07300 [Pyrinomonadaceae bacterium]|jgi:hypothetical protein